MGNSHIGTEHLLLAVLKIKDKKRLVSRACREVGLDYRRARAAVEAFFESRRKRQTESDF
jgi:hypothetical protein